MSGLQEQPKLRFHGHRVDAITLTPVEQSAGSAAERPADQARVKLDVKVRAVRIRGEESDFYVQFDVALHLAEAYSLNVSVTNKFELAGEMSPEETDTLIRLNAPAIAFPYLRAFISTLTANLGGSHPTINLPPYFFDMEQVRIDEIDPDAEDEGSEESERTG